VRSQGDYCTGGAAPGSPNLPMNHFPIGDYKGAEPDGLAQRVAELERFCGQLALENAVSKKALQGAPSRSDTR